jgi:hypothetical protein
MKQSGQQIIGDLIKVDDLTKKWKRIPFNPITYYRIEDDLLKVLDKFEGLYVILDMGHSVVIKIDLDEDADKFMKKFYEYL